jgi:peptidase E
MHARVGEKTMKPDQPTKHIIAIGGRALVAPYTIERYLVELSGKKYPKVALLAQATGESTDYKLRFFTAFSAVGAKPYNVSLLGMVDPLEIAKALLEADIIFVGGGNTKSMLALWREWGVDELLQQAYDNGTILAGVSAGAICWFQQGITDSKIPLSTLPCLGILEGACCPHYDSEQERRPFYTQAAMTGEALPGIALDDHTAGHYIDGILAHVLTWVPGQKVHKVTAEGNAAFDVELLQ